MRFLGIGEYCDLGAMYLRMAKAGHEVKVYVKNPDYHDIYRGMLEFTPNWKNELEWIKSAGSNGIIIFESATHGALQDELRRQGFQVIGGSAYGDQLESDRDFGQQVMHEMGMHIAASQTFHSYEAALAFVYQNPRRYVFKNNGADTLRTKNYVGMMEDGSDMSALLALYKNQFKVSKPLTSLALQDFMLMEYITGIEIGVGAFFNGERFLSPACLDWEHKRFFTGDLGELTGEMGTVVTYRGAEVIFNQTLAQLAPRLKESGYCGYINLNMIANNKGLWPLEFTSRFGYPGFSICGALHQESWESIFKKMLSKSDVHLKTQAGFATGVVLTVPPFPYQYGYAELSKGSPILLDATLSAKEKELIDFSEVETLHGDLFASGMTGCIATAIGKGKTVKSACKQAYQIASKIIVPNVRYRLDIGKNLMEGDWNQLIDWGYISSTL